MSSVGDVILQQDLTSINPPFLRQARLRWPCHVLPAAWSPLLPTTASRDLRGSTLGWHDALRAPPRVCSRTCGASGFLGRSRRDGRRFPVRRCDLDARRGSISSRGSRAGAGVTLPPAGGPLTGGRFHCDVRCSPTAFSRSKRSPQGSGSGARATESPMSPRRRTGRSCAPGFVCVTRLHFTTCVAPAP